MSRLLLVCAFSIVCTMAQAQTATTKPQSPGEMAAHDRAMNEKRADCTRQAKEKKLNFLERRKFVKACVNG
jgi:hypothetical protein